MNVLSHYFEMSRPDAERAIKIYKRFCKQTDEVVQYLSVARQFEHATRLEIPKIKHAPTSLVNSLQEYLDDKDFEVNRRQYMAEQDAKRTGRPIQKVAQTKAQPTTSASASTAPKSRAMEAPAAPTQQAKGPAPDLIDFFESIEQNQQPMAQSVPQFQQQQPQPTGFPQQQQQPFGFQQMPQQTGFQQSQPTGTNPFLQMQQQQQPPPLSQVQPQAQPQAQPQPLTTQFTGAGFGGYGPQPQQQFVGGNAFGQDQRQQQFGGGVPFGQEQQQYSSPVTMQSPQQTQQTTNPFRQSSMPTGAASMPFDGQATQSLQRQATNPFARSTATPPVAGSPFGQQPFSAAQQQQPQPMQPQATGTNPFARNVTPSQQAPPAALQVQATGSTNPFRQSAFVNQQTGAGWQHGPQATMGGLEGLETVPVFPRPGQTMGQQQQSPWG